MCLKPVFTYFVKSYILDYFSLLPVLKSTTQVDKICFDKGQS